MISVTSCSPERSAGLRCGYERAGDDAPMSIWEPSGTGLGGPVGGGAGRPRLARSRSERVWKGVCGGLAETLGVQPVIVRLIVVALAVLHPLAVLVGFELDADDVLAEITDDLLYHGDLNAALRRMLQSGFLDRNQERVAGLREVLEKLRRRRRDELERYDLGGVYDDIAQELRDVVDAERKGIEDLVQEARDSGDERRQQITEEVAGERRMQLDLLPPDLAGQVRALQEYEFTSSEARERFDELMDRLRQQLLQSYFNQMSGALQGMTPEQLQRMKDMFNALNQLLEMREAGQDTDAAFQQFMQQYGDFFPGNPQTLDELLEQMAQQMAAMQSLLNSMTPEQRSQLEGLSRELLEDMDLRWQVDRLSSNLRGAFPQAGWDRRYQFSGADPLGFAEAAQLMDRPGDLD